MEILKPENWEKLEALKGSVGTYIYPPLFAFLLQPLSSLEYELSARIFFLMNFLCLLFSIFLIYKMLSKEGFAFAMFFTLLVNYRFFENHINNNQVAFLLIFLSLFAIYCRNAYLSGFALALAIIIKLTPAIFLLYFFLQKEYKKMFSTLICSFVLLFLPSLAGHEYHIKLLSDWNTLVLQSAMKSPLFRAWKNNQSLVATLAKYFLMGADPVNQPSLSMPFITLQAVQVKLMFYFLGGLSGLSLIWIHYKYKAEKLAIVAMLFILSVILSGISWLHSFSVLLFPVFYLFYLYANGLLDKKEKIAVWIYSILVIFSNRAFIGNTFENHLLLLSLFLYTSYLLYGILVKLTFRIRQV